MLADPPPPGEGEARAAGRSSELAGRYLSPFPLTPAKAGVQDYELRALQRPGFPLARE